jgi:potassium channel subfamily K
MWIQAALLFALASSRTEAGSRGLPLRGPRLRKAKVAGPAVSHLQQPDRGDWAEEVVEHPINEQAQDVSDETVGFKDDHEVYAYTCVALIVLIFLVVAGSWYFIPWDSKIFGISSGNVKISLLLISWAGCGAVMMMAVEGYKPSTAFYVMAQIVTTVGYGDFTPTSWYSQLFMSFYCVLCILVVAGTVSSLAEQAVRRMERQLSSKLASGESKETEPSALAKWTAKYGDLAVATTLFWSMVALGTWYFGYFEGCTCSYGVSKIQGCKDHTQEECRATGGNDFTYMQAFYMSCITLTTVGFGDYSPMSQHGRIFATFWMPIGVACTGNFIRAFSVVFMSGEMEGRGLEIEQCFHRIDTNGDGYLDRYEFVSFCLMEHGLLTKEQFDSINKQYEILDVNGDERVTLEMIKQRGGGKPVRVEPLGSGRKHANAVLQSAGSDRR